MKAKIVSDEIIIPSMQLSDYWSERGREDIVLRYSRKYAESCRQKSPVENATRLQDIML